MSKKLKMGDMVEVSLQNCFWKPGIFVKHGMDGGIICVCDDSEDSYNSESGFNTRYWEKHQWRPIKEKEYRPFTWKERDQLRGNWLVHRSGKECLVIAFMHERREDWILMSTEERCTSLFMLQAYTFLDGSPCGVEVTVDD